MACVLCQHCQGKVLQDDVFVVREGSSYHERCHKCYVCSETNLLKAEVFKGVIFCYSCSQRIFQGCSTARRNKNENRSQSARGKARPKRRERRERSLRRHHIEERRTDRSKAHHTEGVLELTRLAGSITDSGSSEHKKKPGLRNRSGHHTKGVLELTRLPGSITDSGSSEHKKKPGLSDAIATSSSLALPDKEITKEKSKSCKKDSIEMGMTTEVTQELLMQMNCPVVTDRKHGEKQTSPKPRPKDTGDHTFNQTIICSDLRIAELGASTEIAHMALRKRSEVPVIIKSESNMKMNSLTLSGNQESDESGDVNEEWMESTYSLKETERTRRWLDRRIGSILKMPYKCFKKNILDRSSLITVIMSSDRESGAFLTKLKMLFHEEIAEHQHRGVKRLYSTINRRKIPYKLGWLNLMAKVSARCMKNGEISNCSKKPELALNGSINLQSPVTCKHYRTHSYRCMRAQVMRLAGPTKSELGAFRNKLKRTIAPKFVRDLIRMNKKYTAIMMSQACGSDAHEGSTQR